MKRRHKVYLKLNLLSLFFLASIFISITLAWFAYSGIVGVKSEIDIKTWYIEFTKDNEAISNDIVISLDDIYPGMDTVYEDIKIKNSGDSDAKLQYLITSARILDEHTYSSNTKEESLAIEDTMSYDYPFHININVSKNYLRTDDEAYFRVSISWPLDSDNDAEDSLWGNKAYNYQKAEQDKKDANREYVVNNAIKVIINVTAQQYTSAISLDDFNYNLGDVILYDIVNNRSCARLSDTCLKMRVIDTNNTVEDETATLLPEVIGSYEVSNYDNYNNSYNNLTSTWNVEHRKIEASDIVKIVSMDIFDSYLVRNNLSDALIGHILNDERATTEINKLITYKGYYKFKNDSFNFLSSTDCVWLNKEYDTDKGFALKKENDEESRIYGESKTNACKVIPVVIARKSNI